MKIAWIASAEQAKIRVGEFQSRVYGQLAS
jgi:hypothetical protein